MQKAIPVARGARHAFAIRSAPLSRRRRKCGVAGWQGGRGCARPASRSRGASAWRGRRPRSRPAPLRDGAAADRRGAALRTPTPARRSPVKGATACHPSPRRRRADKLAGSPVALFVGDLGRFKEIVPTFFQTARRPLFYWSKAESGGDFGRGFRARFSRMGLFGGSTRREEGGTVAAPARCGE